MKRPWSKVIEKSPKTIAELLEEVSENVSSSALELKVITKTLRGETIKDVNDER